ncbi:MAG: type II/IV secretion system protein, partial [Prochlorococcus sp.]
MTQGRPIPKATTSSQQRLELELLLQVSLVTPEELANGLNLIASHNNLDAATWQQFQALPININDHHLEVAIAHQLDELSKNELISALQSRGFTTEFRIALASDLTDLLNPTSSKQPIESEFKPTQAKPLTESKTSLLAGFSAESVLEENPEEQTGLTNAIEDL